MRLGVDLSILNQKGTPAFYSDIFANRPAFGYAGRVFISTDTGAIYQDTGTAWVLIADAGAGTTGTLQQVTTNGKTTDQGITITAGGLSTNSLTDTALTAGSVLFSGAAGLVSQDNATFFWDSTNKRLGIGNAAPGAPLDVHGTGVNAQFNGTGTNNAYVQFQNAGTSKWRLGNFYNAGANSFEVTDMSTTTLRLSIRSTGELYMNGYNTISNTPTFSSSGNYASNPSLNLTVPASSTFNSGATFAGMATSLLNAFDGSSTIGSGAVMAGFVGVNRQSFNAAGYTVTLTQGASGIRAVCGMQVLQQTGGSFTGTITHGASLLVQGVYPTNATNITYTNYYGLLINQLDEYGGVTFTNRWGIYQGGASDKNYFAGSVGISTSTPSAKLEVSGSTTASGAVARGAVFSPTLVAAANGDTLSGVYISPTFTNGAFTGVNNWALNLYGNSYTNGLVYINGSSGTEAIIFVNNGTNDWQIGTKTGDATQNFSIYNYGTTSRALYFDKTTNNAIFQASIGLNTSTIGSKLQVNGNAAIGYSASTAAPTNGLLVNGNIGVTVTSAGGVLQPLDVRRNGGNVYPTLGTNPAGANMFISNTQGLFGMYLGVIGADGTGWIQQMRNDTATAYSLALNPSGGNVWIGSQTDVASAKLQVASTTQGFLPPVMTTTQKNAISSPAAGLIVFDTTLAKLCVYASGAWQTITSV